MKLIDVLNQTNSGRKIPMWVWDVYSARRDRPYIKRAYFHIKSFDYLSQESIQRYLSTETGKSYSKSLVEIDHLEEINREVIFFLKLNNEVWQHYEPADASFTYSRLEVNDKMEIIGGGKLDVSTMKFSTFLFDDV